MLRADAGFQHWVPSKNSFDPETTLLRIQPPSIHSWIQTMESWIEPVGVLWQALQCPPGPRETDAKGEVTRLPNVSAGSQTRRGDVLDTPDPRPAQTPHRRIAGAKAKVAREGPASKDCKRHFSRISASHSCTCIPPSCLGARESHSQGGAASICPGTQKPSCRRAADQTTTNQPLLLNLLETPDF